MRFKWIFQASYMLITTAALVVLGINQFKHEPSLPISVLTQQVPDSSELEQQIDASTQQIAQVASALTQLEDKLSRLESTQRQPSKPAPVSRVQTVSANDALDPVTPDAQTEDAFELPQQGFDAERMQFAAESFDADWSLATEASALTALTEFDILDIELDTATCYQSGCQLEFTHLNNENDELLVEQLQSSDAFAGEFFAQTITADDGTMRTIMIVGKADEIIVDETAF